MLLALRYPETSPMILDNRSTERKANTCAGRFGCKESIEDVGSLIFRDTYAIVAEIEQQFVQAIDRRADRNSPRPAVRRFQSLDRVGEEVDKHLLYLRAIGGDIREGFVQRKLD